MAAASAGTAFVQIKPDWGNFNQALSSGLSSAQSQLSSFGASMTRSFTVPIVGAASVAGMFGIKTAAATEQAQIAFEQLLPVGSDVNAFMSELVDFAKVTPFDVPTINAAAQGLLGVGVNAKDVLPILTGLGDSVAAFGGSSAQVDQVNYAMKQIIGSGKAYTQDINQIGTTVPTIWQEVAAQMGVTVGEAREMASEGQITSDVLVKAFTEPVGPLATLAGSMEKQSATLTGMWSTFKDEVGAGLGQAFTQAMPQIKDALGQLSAAIGPALQSAGPAFAGIVQAMIPLVSLVGSALTAFAGLSPEMQKLVVYAVAVTAAIGPVALGVSRLLGAFKAIGGLLSAVKTFTQVAMAISRIYGITGLLIKVGMAVKTFVQVVVVSMRILATGLLTNPVTLIIIAIVAAIAAAAYLIYRNWDTIKAAFSAAMTFIGGILSSIWSTIKGVFDGIVSAISTAFSFIVGVFTSIWSVVLPIWQTFWAIITLPARIAMTVLLAIIQVAWALLVAAFNFIKDVVMTVWSALWDAVSAYISFWWGIVSAIFSAVWDFIVTVFNGIKSAVLTVWNALWSVVSSVWETVSGKIRTGISAVKDFVVDAFNSMKDKISSIWDSIKSVVQRAVDAVVGVGQGIWNGLKGVINTGIGLLNSAINGFNKIIGAVNAVPGVNIPTIPTIPKLAKGGIVTRPTLAVAGEAGPEAVIPLSRLSSTLGSSGGDTYITVRIGDQDITNMIEETIRSDRELLTSALRRGRRI